MRWRAGEEERWWPEGKENEGHFACRRGSIQGGGRGRGGKSASLVREDQAIMLAPGLGQNCDFLIYV